jgi:hypothetical protein
MSVARDPGNGYYPTSIQLGDSWKFLRGDSLDGLADRLDFRVTKFLEDFFNRGDAAKLPAQTVWTASVLTQYQFGN